MENTTTINITKEANITGKGKHRGGNAHAAIATELFEARTSQVDMATYLHTSFKTVSAAITGRTSRAGVYKRDENGNLRRVGWTRVYRANDPRVVDALLQNGKKLLKEKEELVKENKELKEKAAALDAHKDKSYNYDAYHAYKDQKEKVKALDADIKKLKAKLLEAVEAHNAAVAELVELEKAL